MMIIYLPIGLFIIFPVMSWYIWFISILHVQSLRTKQLDWTLIDEMTNRFTAEASLRNYTSTGCIECAVTVLSKNQPAYSCNPIQKICVIYSKCHWSISAPSETPPVDIGWRHFCREIVISLEGSSDFTTVGTTSMSRRNYIRFQIKSDNDAYVVLGPSSTILNPIHYILFGTWQNSKSCILEKHEDNAPIVSVRNGKHLSQTSFKSFWMSWKDGHIRVGTGMEVGTDQILNDLHTPPKDINFIMLRSNSGNGAVFNLILNYV